MNQKPTKPLEELDDEDRTLIHDAFLEKVVPKLRMMDARIGTLTCDFAGEKYKHWVVHFRSSRSDFEIVEFEYDEDARALDLDL